MIRLINIIKKIWYDLGANARAFEIHRPSLAEPDAYGVSVCSKCGVKYQEGASN